MGCGDDSSSSSSEKEVATSKGDCVFAASPFGAGDGTPGDPYQVCTVAHFNEVGNYSDKYFLQVDNLNFIEESGHTPIGDFFGEYDGNDKAISNITVNETGLAAVFVQLTGTLKDITFSDISITGGSIGVAGVVGYNHGVIDGLTVSGNLTVASSDVEMPMGGVVLYNFGAMSDVTFDGRIISGMEPLDEVTETTTPDSYMGGLVAKNINGATISSSYASVILEGRKYMGGCVGSNEGSVSNIECDSIMSFTNFSYYIGGVMGFNSGTALLVTANTTMHNPYKYTGGIAGISSGTIEKAVASGGIYSFGWSGTGGLLGRNSVGATLSLSKSNVTLFTDTLPSPSSVGGLVGINYATIENSYSYGKIEVNDDVGDTGGIVGLNGGTGEITNTYSNSEMIGGADNNFNNGGVGDNDGTITASFFNSAKTEKDDDEDNDALSAEELMVQANFCVMNEEIPPACIAGTEWDFEDVWSIVDGQMPTLAWENE